MTPPIGYPTAAPEQDAGAPSGLGAAVGLVLCCLSALLAGVVEVLLVPLYAGAVILPVTVPLAVLSNVALPVLCARQSAAPVAAPLPVVVWLLTVATLAILPRPEGDVLVPGAGAPATVALVMVGAGTLAGVLTVRRTGAVLRRR